jgi:methylmalonyl-CoA/ethylmalonyl-CoA epimerase
MTFHHLGVACDDIASEIPRFQILGYRQEGRVFRDPIQKVEGAFMTGPGPRLELLAPLDASSPVGPWLEKGVKYYHQGFEVPCMEEALGRMAARRGRVVAPPAPGVAFDGRQIAFVMLPGMILIELIQMEATT